MLRSVSLFAALVFVVGHTQTLSAQQDPLAAADPRMAGSWKLDPTASDSIPRALMSAPPASSASRGATSDAGAGAGAGAGAAAGGRAGGGGRTRGGGGGGGGAARGGGARPGGPPGGDLEGRGAILAEIAPEVLNVKVEGTQTVVSNAEEEDITWTTDKKKRQVATSRGSLFEMESSWWTKTLQTIRTLADGSELKRDMKVSNDGKTMEVKLQVKLTGKKTELKLKYTKVE